MGPKGPSWGLATVCVPLRNLWKVCANAGQMPVPHRQGSFWTLVVDGHRWLDGWNRPQAQKRPTRCHRKFKE